MAPFSHRRRNPTVSRLGCCILFLCPKAIPLPGKQRFDLCRRRGFCRGSPRYSALALIDLWRKRDADSLHLCLWVIGTFLSLFFQLVHHRPHDLADGPCGCDSVRA